jgi:hypothetical protein
MKKTLSPRALLIFAALYTLLSAVCFFSFAFHPRPDGEPNTIYLVVACGFAAVAIAYYWRLFRAR